MTARARVAAFVLVLAAAVSVFGGAGIEGSRIAIDQPWGTVPGGAVELWINPDGVLTRYDATLGERLSVQPFAFGDFSNTGATLTNAMLRCFSGIDSDTSVGDPTGQLESGWYCPTDGWLSMLQSKRDGLATSAVACTIRLYVVNPGGTSVRRVMVLGNDSTTVKTFADSTLKVYEGERLAARVTAGSPVDDVSLTFAFYTRDSTGAAVP